VRWVLQNGNAVSVRPTADFDLGRGPQRPGILIRAGIKQRAELFGWSLTNEEMQRLDEMTSPDGNPTYVPAPLDPKPCKLTSTY
jgi:hypothetical protein